MDGHIYSSGWGVHAWNGEAEILGKVISASIDLLGLYILLRTSKDLEAYYEGVSDSVQIAWIAY